VDHPGNAVQGTGVNVARGVVGGAGVGVGGAGVGAGGATVWHPAIQSATSAQAVRRDRRCKGDIMGWILLEALVALLIAIGIVWWTMSGRRKPPRDRRDPPGKP
jgi:hypothetical protein